MSSALLTAHFQLIMDNAQINDAFYGFDASQEESHSFYLETVFNADTAIWHNGDYTLCTVPDDDAPTALLYHKEQVVGLYRDMMAWIEPGHRGKGLGACMIMEFAEHFGEDAFQSGAGDPADGIGFTVAGYAAHQAARELAENRLTATPSI